MKKRVKKRSLDSLSNLSRLAEGGQKNHSILEYFPRKLGGHSKSFGSEFKAKTLFARMVSDNQKMEDIKPNQPEDLQPTDCVVDLCEDSDVEMDTSKPLDDGIVRAHSGDTERKPVLKEINSPKKPADPINVNSVKEEANSQLTRTTFPGKYPKRELEESENEDVSEPSKETVDKLATMNSSPMKFVDIHRFLQVTLDVNGDSPKKNDAATSQSNEPQYYTLKHFRTIMNDILHDNHYAHLFNDDDWGIITKFTELESRSFLT